MRTDILGVGIDGMTKEEALALAAERIRAERFTRVYTPNPLMIRQALKDPQFRQIINRGHINLADGIGVILAARILALPLHHRAAGIEFGQLLLSYAARTGRRVFLLGGRPGVAKRAAARLTKQLPGLIICGIHHGYFSDSQATAVIRKIEATHADIVLVCLGSPKQERWIDAHRPRGVLLMAALGGSLDVWSGHTERAPRILSHMGLEWLWRMMSEPRRLSGIVPICQFLAAAVAERMKQKKQQAKVK